MASILSRVASEASYVGSGIEEPSLKRTERKVFSFDLIVRARAEHAEPPTLATIAQSWKARFDADDCSHERNRGRIIYRIGDLEINEDPGILNLLIRQCDADAANAVYGKRDTGRLRIIAKDDDEGGEKAAHISISLVEDTAKPHHYLCHMEIVPGLTHSVIQAMLNAVLRNSIRNEDFSYTYPDPGGARTRGGAAKVHDYVPHVEFLGHPSPTLAADLEAGRILGLTLVTPVEKASLGGNRYLTERDHKIEVDVAPNLPRANRMKRIFDALRLGTPDYEKVRVRFNDPEGLARSVEFDVATETTDDTKYIRSYLVSDIDPPMDEASDKLVPFLRNALQSRVLDERS